MPTKPAGLSAREWAEERARQALLAYHAEMRLAPAHRNLGGHAASLAGELQGLLAELAVDRKTP